jgi:hypothetical protein
VFILRTTKNGCEERWWANFFAEKVRSQWLRSTDTIFSSILLALKGTNIDVDINYGGIGYAFIFENEEDATAFLLRWS